LQSSDLPESEEECRTSSDKKSDQFAIENVQRIQNRDDSMEISVSEQEIPDFPDFCEEKYKFSE
jgi:hypothetical protein